jgi:D-alanyl-D-alanine carboxypeptidase
MTNLSTRLSAFFLFLLFTFSGLLPALAQQGPVSPAVAAALQARLDQERINKNLVGVSAAVIIPGQGVWRGASGMSHGTVPIDTAMVFAIGSITKTIVSTTVLLLAQDSLLSLTDSLHNWLPSYPNIDSNITVRQLLQHRSGLFNYTNSQTWGTAVNSNLYATWTADQILNNYVNPPLAAPGAMFSYCNTNYLLLGRIIEEVTDSAWWEVVRHRLLDRYQLSGIYAEQIEPGTGLMPHNWQLVSGVKYDLSSLSRTAIWTSASSAGCMAANSFDVARFAKLLFEGQILQPAWLAQMKQFGSVPGGASFNGYGLGLMRINNLGQSVWGHGGNIPGFASMMIYSPVDSISVSVLINQDWTTIPIGLAMLQTAQQALTLDAAAELDQEEPQLACYPNPSAGAATVYFSFSKPGRVELQLLNSVGQEVAQLASGNHSSGKHQLPVSVEHLPNGLYFCRLTSEAGVKVQPLVIAR